MEAGVSLSGLQSTTEVTVPSQRRQSLASDLKSNSDLPVSSSAVSAAPLSPSSASSVQGTVVLSAQGLAVSDAERSVSATENGSRSRGDTADSPKTQNSPAGSADSDKQRAEQADELAQIEQLSKRDREVRAHEAAHAAAGGSLSGSPSFEYSRGPDGKLYATGGEVSIDTSAVSNDPRATIEKAQTIIQAALAPANPSPQDIQVAARAQAMLVEAQSELTRLDTEAPEVRETGESAGEEVSESDRDEQDRDTVEERLERSREEREKFADQLRELNSRIGEVQQRLIESGATEGISSRSTFLDLIV